MAATIRILCVLTICAGLCACAVGPNYHTPATRMPDGFASTQSTTQPATTQRVDLTLWWKSFGDPELDSLVERAIAANFDLDIALTRLQEARTQEVVISGAALPMADASGAAARGSGTNSTKGRIGAPLNAASNTTGLKEITDIVGFDAGWELDIFGKFRRESEATRADAQAALDERNAVLITVISDVARTYIETRALQARLAILQSNIGIERQTVDVVQVRYNRGLTNELDLALALRQLATLESELLPLQAQAQASERQLAVLLGEFPDDLDAELQSPAALPQLPAQIQPGLPVDLLRRRPDIRQAERELAANTALIGARTADLFPTIAVTAGAGLQGQGLGRTPAKTSFIWSAGPEAYWPLLDFGQLDALIQIQDLRTHEALANYKKTIVSAVEEVDDAITAYAAEQSRLQFLASALTASQRAATLAHERYNRGLTDFLNVTDAERQLYELQDQYEVAQESATLQYIAVYKGLGGGWENYQSIPPIRNPQPAIVATFAHPEHPNQ
jgi:NodT family efflux transporter outer membrane factor (OMF) lipoprotein